MKRRAIWISVMALVVAAVVTVLSAQERIVFPQGSSGPQPQQVITGADIGFQVEGTGRDGAVRGRFMVRVDGQWKEIELVPRIRIAR